MKKPATDAIILIIIALVAIAWSAITSLSMEDSGTSIAPTSYNPDPRGNKAFYTLLTRLGFKTQRLRKPYSSLPENTSVLIVVEPSNQNKQETDNVFFAPGIDRKNIELLQKWVRDGGTLVMVSRFWHDPPEYFAESGKLGSGYVYMIDDIKTICNEGMRKPENAVKMVRIVEDHAKRGDLVVFDEYHHGLHAAEDGLELSPTVISAIVIIGIAGLLWIYSSARRFGMVREPGAIEQTRPLVGLVESTGQMYVNSGDPAISLDILSKSLINKLAARTGLPSDTPLESFLGRLDEKRRIKLEKILQLERTLQAGKAVDQKEIVKTAAEISRLEKEL